MDLKEGILDSLVNDVRTIKNIKDYLIALGIDSGSGYVDLKKKLIELLDKSLIKVTYPQEKSVEYFINLSTEHEQEQIWFELTERGYEEWKGIP